jgi:DNA ligase-1
MLAKSYDMSMDPTGFFASEKLDGIRSIFVNGKFISRNNNEFKAPDWFVENMPKNVVLDGELFTKRGDFQGVVSAVKKHKPIDSEWQNVVYMVFDIPDLIEPFTTRYAELQKVVKQANNRYIKLVKNFPIKSKQHLSDIQQDILSKGGEGVMIRDPESYYESKRSSSLLKLKTFHDDEAVVIDYELGSGKYADVLGNLVVKWYDKSKPQNITFDIGSGFSDEQRTKYKKMFPKGTIIKFKYFEIGGKSFKPRFPVFLGVRSKKDL